LWSESFRNHFIVKAVKVQPSTASSKKSSITSTKPIECCHSIAKPKVSQKIISSRRWILEPLRNAGGDGNFHGDKKTIMFHELIKFIMNGKKATFNLAVKALSGIFFLSSNCSIVVLLLLSGRPHL